MNELGYPQEELWVDWLPAVHRAITDPAAAGHLKPLAECRSLQEIQAYWECLEYLLGVVVGWHDIGIGLAWWYRNDKDPQGDDRLALVLRHWDDQGQLDFYAAHHWRNGFSCHSPDQIFPTELSLHSKYKELEWWRMFQARGKTCEYDPFYGGSNPLHLGISEHIGQLHPYTPATAFHGSHKEEFPAAVVITSGFRHWRNDLWTFSNSLPELKNRSWRIEVFDRIEGYLGLFRKSRVTGLWFQGKHRVHLEGN